MSGYKFLRIAFSLLIALVFLLMGVSPVQAQPPDNDDFDNAILITSLPYADTRNTSEATYAIDDPGECHNNGSVWYAFTPLVDIAIEANTIGSDYDTTLAAYTGTRGALTLVPGACNDDYYGTQSRINFTAVAGTTYYFLVGTCCGQGGNGGGNLVFSVYEILPPPNDDFANAILIGSLPFEEQVDMRGATIEAGEPMPTCGWTDNTAWYAFTPTESGSISANNYNYDVYPFLAVYMGDALSNLTELSCTDWDTTITIGAEVGQTYYFQIGGLGGGRGQIYFRLITTPPPDIWNIGIYPGDPSIFDTIDFCADVFDPGNVGFESFNWDFGDGFQATTTDSCIAHQYTADGDYTISFTVTTHDGRSASTSQVVQVRTHDVTITKFSVPKSASSGQTRTITVGLKNLRYAEMVEVRLYKSTPGDWVEVGVLTQYVPKRAGNRTTNFLFSYTFTPDDARMGKVVFRAVATIQNFRDALPADNEAISQPVKVAK